MALKKLVKILKKNQLRKRFLKSEKRLKVQSQSFDSSPEEKQNAPDMWDKSNRTLPPEKPPIKVRDAAEVGGAGIAELGIAGLAQKLKILVIKSRYWCHT